MNVEEITVLANPNYLAGRLKTIADRNGYAVNITHQTFTAQQINQSPDLQWQINTVTDPYGRVATFQYEPAQVSNRWVVSQIALPNGQNVSYGYAKGRAVDRHVRRRHEEHVQLRHRRRQPRRGSR